MRNKIRSYMHNLRPRKGNFSNYRVRLRQKIAYFNSTYTLKQLKMFNSIKNTEKLSLHYNNAIAGTFRMQKVTSLIPEVPLY